MCYLKISLLQRIFLKSPSAKNSVFNPVNVSVTFLYVLQETPWATSAITTAAVGFCFETTEHHLQSHKGACMFYKSFRFHLCHYLQLKPPCQRCTFAHDSHITPMHNEGPSVPAWKANVHLVHLFVFNAHIWSLDIGMIFGYNSQFQAICGSSFQCCSFKKTLYKL